MGLSVRAFHLALSLGMCSIVAASLAGCAAAEASNDQAPEVASESIDPQDEGTSYNGWSMSAYGDVHVDYGYANFGHYFGRSYGDSTRGGGSCFVHHAGESCTSDESCTTAAKANYGSSAYGYCYSGTCYTRAGSQGSSCSINSNSTPGYYGATVSSGSIVPTGDYYVLGCMTKLSGPNTACGCTSSGTYLKNGQTESCGSNYGTHYMRSVVPATVYSGPPI